MMFMSRSSQNESLLAVTEELRRREPIFHRPEFGTARANFEALMDDGFWEVGASGRIYDRDEVLEVLTERFRDSNRQEDVWEVSDFACRELSADFYLATYTLLQDDQRKTRRATLWRRSGDVWKIVYHQGTLAP